MAVIPVDIAGRPYEVRVGAGLLAELVPHCRGRLRKRGVPIVTDANVHAAWGHVLDAALGESGHEPRWRILPPGEASKSWDQLAATVDWLLAEEVERGDHILALGGGVIGDLTGFAAAIVKRGCRFIQLPTSLLAQVDSSVGGKTAINTPAGKNLVGAFHQPALVLADLAVLDTLPERELRAGYAEVVKYGLIGDPDFFAWCDEHGAAMLAGDASLREYAVAHSVAAKARIVAEDEHETSGVRALLNLGHTFGHALEAATNYDGARLVHGEGVAIGMALAHRFSTRMNLASSDDALRVEAHLLAVGLPTRIADIPGSLPSPERLLDYIRQDKKVARGALTFILTHGVGKAFIARDVPVSEVLAFLKESHPG